mmetsp:Transcript_64307/g.147338  ORF Transcript_64307/g.147338 Transcript_64307/m.147338 type:complete len:367 (-) Transcript_64307:44-1144(-)
MEQLVRTLAPYSLRPAVLPGLREMTVGGAIAGLSGDSTSFAKGFFHDACLNFEVVLGDGSVVMASNENQFSDIFHAYPGTFGSLGILAAATIRLVRAEPYVAMRYCHFDDPSDLSEYLMGGKSRGVTFLEGIGFAPNSLVACEGIPATSAQATSGTVGEIQRLDRFLDPSFKKLVAGKRGGMSEGGEMPGEFLSLEDYLFRHDKRVSRTRKLRSVLGSLLARTPDQSKILLQAFMVPAPNVASFMRNLEQRLSIWPLWFCPVSNCGRPPPIFSIPEKAGDFIAIAVAGAPTAKVFDMEEDNRAMERELLLHNGRKVHLSTAFYPMELFYGQIYDGNLYADLREKYRAEEAFPHVWEKIVGLLEEDE